jgi:hypothetical protein
MRLFIFGEKKYVSYLMLLISCIFLDETFLSRRHGKIRTTITVPRKDYDRRQLDPRIVVRSLGFQCHFITNLLFFVLLHKKSEQITE